MAVFFSIFDFPPWMLRSTFIQLDSNLLKNDVPFPNGNLAIRAYDTISLFCEIQLSAIIELTGTIVFLEQLVLTSSSLRIPRLPVLEEKVKIYDFLNFARIRTSGFCL